MDSDQPSGAELIDANSGEAVGLLVAQTDAGVQQLLGELLLELLGAVVAVTTATRSEEGCDGDRASDGEGPNGSVTAPPSRGRCGSYGRSEEHTSELQSLMRISYAVFCLKKKTRTTHTPP